MGTPIPTEPPPAEPCSLCDGLIWLPGETPYWLILMFSGVQSCPGFPPFPNSTNIWLHQRPGAPCSWELYGAYFIFRIAFTTFWSYMHVYHGENGTAYNFFKHINPVVCDAEFTNQLLTCNPPAVCGTGGTCLLWVPP